MGGGGGSWRDEEDDPSVALGGEWLGVGIGDGGGNLLAGGSRIRVDEMKDTLEGWKREPGMADLLKLLSPEHIVKFLVSTPGYVQGDTEEDEAALVAVTLKACCGFARAAQDAREELMESANGQPSSRRALAQVDGEVLEALKGELASLEAEASQLRRLLDEAKGCLREQRELEEAHRRDMLEREMSWDERAAKEREDALSKLEEVLRKEAMENEARLEQRLRRKHEERERELEDELRLDAIAVEREIAEKHRVAMQDLRDELEAARECLEDSKTHLRETRGKAAEHERAEGGYRRVAQDLERVLAETRRDLDAERSRGREAEREAGPLRSEMARLELEAARRKAEADKLSDGLASAQQEVVRLEIELEVLRSTQQETSDRASITHESEKQEILRLELELEKMRGSLADATEKHEETVAGMRSTHAETVERMELSHGKAIEKIQKTHAEAMERMRGTHGETVERIRAANEEMVARHAATVEKMQASLDEAMQKHSETVEKMRENHAGAIERLRRAHAEQVEKHAEAMGRMRISQSEALEKLEQTHVEAVEKMRRSQAETVEKLQAAHAEAMERASLSLKAPGLGAVERVPSTKPPLPPGGGGGELGQQASLGGSAQVSPQVSHRLSSFQSSPYSSSRAMSSEDDPAGGGGAEGGGEGDGDGLRHHRAGDHCVTASVPGLDFAMLRDSELAAAREEAEWARVRMEEGRREWEGEREKHKGELKAVWRAQEDRLKAVVKEREEEKERHGVEMREANKVWEAEMERVRKELDVERERNGWREERGGEKEREKEGERGGRGEGDVEKEKVGKEMERLKGELEKEREICKAAREALERMKEKEKGIEEERRAWAKEREEMRKGWGEERRGWDEERSAWVAEKEGWKVEREGWEVEREGFVGEREVFDEERERWEREREGWVDERCGWDEERLRMEEEAHEIVRRGEDEIARREEEIQAQWRSREVEAVEEGKRRECELLELLRRAEKGREESEAELREELDAAVEALQQERDRSGVQGEGAKIVMEALKQKRDAADKERVRARASEGVLRGRIIELERVIGRLKESVEAGAKREAQLVKAHGYHRAVASKGDAEVSSAIRSLEKMTKTLEGGVRAAVSKAENVLEEERKSFGDARRTFEGERARFLEEQLKFENERAEFNVLQEVLVGLAEERRSGGRGSNGGGGRGNGDDSMLADVGECLEALDDVSQGVSSTGVLPDEAARSKTMMEVSTQTAVPDGAATSLDRDTDESEWGARRTRVDKQLIVERREAAREREALLATHMKKMEEEKERIEGLGREMVVMEGRVWELEREREEKEGRLGELEREREVLEGRVKVADVETLKLKVRISELETDCEGKAASIVDLRGERDKLSVQLGALRGERDELVTDLRNERDAHSATSKDVEALRSERDAAVEKSRVRTSPRRNSIEGLRNEGSQEGVGGDVSTDSWYAVGQAPSGDDTERRESASGRVLTSAENTPHRLYTSGRARSGAVVSATECTISPADNKAEAGLRGAIAVRLRRGTRLLGALLDWRDTSRMIAFQRLVATVRLRAAVVKFSSSELGWFKRLVAAWRGLASGTGSRSLRAAAMAAWRKRLTASECISRWNSASLYARLRSEQVHERAQRQCVISASRAFHAWACGIDSGRGAREAGERYTLMWRRKRMLRRACAVWWGIVSRGHMIVYLRDKWGAAPRHSDRSVFSAWQRVTACEHRARAAKLRWLQDGSANSVVHAWRMAARRSAWIGARVERMKNARDRGGVEFCILVMYRHARRKATTRAKCFGLSSILIRRRTKLALDQWLDVARRTRICGVRASAHLSKVERRMCGRVLLAWRCGKGRGMLEVWWKDVGVGAAISKLLDARADVRRLVSAFGWWRRLSWRIKNRQEKSILLRFSFVRWSNEWGMRGDKERSVCVLRRMKDRAMVKARVVKWRAFTRSATSIRQTLEREASTRSHETRTLCFAAWMWGTSNGRRCRKRAGLMGESITAISRESMLGACFNALRTLAASTKMKCDRPRKAASAWFLSARRARDGYCSRERIWALASAASAWGGTRFLLCALTQWRLITSLRTHQIAGARRRTMMVVCAKALSAWRFTTSCSESIYLATWRAGARRIRGVWVMWRRYTVRRVASRELSEAPRRMVVGFRIMRLYFSSWVLWVARSSQNAACGLVEAALSGVYTTLCSVQAAVPGALRMAEMRGARLESAKADAAASARAEELADGQRKIVEEEKRAHDALKKCLEEEARKVEAAQREVVEARGEAEVWKDAVERLREEVCDAVDAASSELEMEKQRGRELEEELAEVRGSMSMLKEHSRHLELLGGIISATNTSHNHPPRGTGSVSCGDSNTVRSTSSGALQRYSGAVQRSSMVASSRGGQDQREYREQYQHHGDGVLDDPMNSLVDARRGRGNLSSIHRLHPSSTGDASTMPRYLPSSPARGEDGNLLSRRGSNSRARDESLVFMLDSWRKTSGSPWQDTSDMPLRALAMSTENKSPTMALKASPQVWRKKDRRDTSGSFDDSR